LCHNEVLNIAHKNCFKNQKDPLSPKKKLAAILGRIARLQPGGSFFSLEKEGLWFKMS